MSDLSVKDRIEGVIIGDLHWQEAVGRGTWSDLPAVRGDLEHALRQAVGLCVSLKSDLYLAGDNFDGPDPEPDSVAALYEILRPVLEAKGNVFYIIGNHDRGRDWLAPLGPRAMRIEDGKAFHTRFGKTVSGLNYQEPDRFMEAVRSVVPTDIGLYHQSFREWTGGRGFPLSVLPPHRLAICGDTHVAMEFSPSPGVVRLSPGSLVPQSTTEFNAPSGVWKMSSDCTVSPYQIAGRKRLRRVISSPDEADRILSEIAAIDCEDKTLPSRIRQPIVAVRLTSAIDGFVDVLRKLADDRGFHLRVSDDSRAPKVKPTVPVGSSTLADAILGWPVSQDVKDLALAALTPGADPKSVFNKDLHAETANSGPL